MDFKKTYPGGETKIEASDILYMQYSNYWAEQALAYGIDINNTGVIVKGCVVTPYWDSVLGASADISDGYIIIKGELIKVEGTATSNFADAETGILGNTRHTYLYAKPLINYNTKGDKTYNDGSLRQTFQETRIQLVMKQFQTIEPDEVSLGYITFEIGIDGVDDYTTNIFDIDETLIRSNNASVSDMKNRDGISYKIVTPDALHQSFGNYQIKQYFSNDKLDLTIPGGARWTFVLPSTVTTATLIGAFAYGSATGPTNLQGVQISNTPYRNWSGSEPDKDDDEYLTWTFDLSTKTLNVYFQISPTDLSNVCYATILITE